MSRLLVTLSLALSLSSAIAGCNSSSSPNPEIQISPASSPSAIASPTVSSSPPETTVPSPTASPAAAPGSSTYQGGGFTVTVTGFGGSASYKGCDRQNRCLEIPQASSHQQGTYTWENSSYTYIMSPLAEGNYRLRVIDPNDKTIVNTPVSPVTRSSAPPTDPEYVQELTDNTQCSFIAVDSGSVNVRKGPGTQHGVVTQLKRGDGVRAVSREGDWVKLAARVYGTTPDETFEPLEGWVSKDYINGCSEDKFEMWRQ